MGKEPKYRVMWITKDDEKYHKELYVDRVVAKLRYTELFQSPNVLDVAMGPTWNLPEMRKINVSRNY